MTQVTNDALAFEVSVRSPAQYEQTFTFEVTEALVRYAPAAAVDLIVAKVRAIAEIVCEKAAA